MSNSEIIMVVRISVKMIEDIQALYSLEEGKTYHNL
jgi:hypothetical protein